MNQILTGFASKQEKTDQLMVFFNVLNCVILNCSYLIFDIHEHRPCFIKALKNIIIELFMGGFISINHAGRSLVPTEELVHRPLVAQKLTLLTLAQAVMLN